MHGIGKIFSQDLSLNESDSSTQTPIRGPSPKSAKNLSGGGVAVQIDVAPPWNQTIWLSLGPVGEEAGPAECRLVGFRNDQPGKLIARFSFVDLCPLHLHQAAIEIPK